MKIKKLKEILPPEPVLLMGAGPVPIPMEVQHANGVVISHLGKNMNYIIKEIRRMGSYVFKTKSDKILGIAGPASAAMEMAISNLTTKDSRVLVLKMGLFSGRFGEMAGKLGANVDFLDTEGEIITPGMLKLKMSQNEYDIVTMVQGETSCGVWNKYVPELTKIAKVNGCRVVLDAVCTLSTMNMEMDNWGIDIVVTGGQKGLSSIPGVSLIAFSEDVWLEIMNKEDEIPHWCLDVKKAKEFWLYNNYHYTAPVPGILALYEALRLICEETLEKRFQRHKKSSLLLQEGLEVLGCKLYTPKEYRLNSVVAVQPPIGIDSSTIIKDMLLVENIEIASSFGLDIFRIGQMGEQCKIENIQKVIIGLANVLDKHTIKYDKISFSLYLEKLKS